MKTLNRKILTLTIALLAVVALAAPLIGPAQACRNRGRAKTIVPYEASIVMTVVTQPTFTKWSDDGLLVIRKGSLREGAYDGPLGNGTLYSENIISITKFDVYINGTPAASIGHGFGIYREQYVIDSGPYGAGTLTGITIMQWDIQTVDDPKSYTYWAYCVFGQGTGDLAGIKLTYSLTGTIIPPAPGLQSGTLILP